MLEKNLLDDYINQLYAPATPLLQEVEQKINSHNWQIQISPLQGKMLQLLISLTAARKVVEIGTLLGYSTLWIAQALYEHDLQEPAVRKEEKKLEPAIIYTIEHDQYRHSLAVEHFAQSKELSSYIKPILGDAHKILPDLSAQGPFDMVFIDADKGGYLDYLSWAKENLKAGGLLVADNTLLRGRVYGVENNNDSRRIRENTIQQMQEFNLLLADNHSFQSILIPIRDGMTIARRR